MILNFSKKAIKEFFTYTRSEIRGIIVLAALIIILLSIKIYNGTRNNIFSFEISENNKALNNLETAGENYESASAVRDNVKPVRKPFDPNTISYNDLKSIGLRENVVQNILKYRSKGGKFRNSGDLLKIYGIDSFYYAEIEPYIIISDTFAARSPKTNNQSRVYLINLNSADSAELTFIPGIGPVLSQRIIKYRTILGGFYSKEQLKEVYGISDSLFNTISSHIHIDTSKINSINLNTCQLEQLKRHPYISNYQAKAILAYRKLSGPFTDKMQLSDNFLLSEEIYLKVAPYLSLK